MRLRTNIASPILLDCLHRNRFLYWRRLIYPNKKLKIFAMQEGKQSK